MRKLYELKVAPNHRFAELSVATKKGKIWVGKEESVIVGSDDLLAGEEFKLMRYAEEGRMLVEEVQAEAETATPAVQFTEPVETDPLAELDVSEKAWALAVKHDIDLTEVEGKGKDGRIIFRDVEALVKA